MAAGGAAGCACGTGAAGRNSAKGAAAGAGGTGACGLAACGLWLVGTLVAARGVNSPGGCVGAHRRVHRRGRSPSPQSRRRIRSRSIAGRYGRSRLCRHRSQCRSRSSGRARCRGSLCVATRRQCFGLRLQRGNCAKIVRLGSCCQGTRINFAHFSEKRIGLVFGQEWAEAQAVARPSILGALYLIHVGGCGEFGELLRRRCDGRGGCAQIDHEGSRAAEAWHLLQRLEQVLDA